MNELTGRKAAVLIADNFQDEEGVEPVEFLRERGMEVQYVGLERGTARSKHGRQEIRVEKTVTDADPRVYDLLIIPGGAAPEALRLSPEALGFTRSFFDRGTPVAAICHGPQVLISAGVLPGRIVTCYAGIRDDVIRAGARYLDKKVVVDRGLVTSRVPGDIPAFNAALLGVLLGEGAKPADAAAGAVTEEAGEEV